MSVSVRAAFPSGTTTATTGTGVTNVTTSVTLVAGDALDVHVVVDDATDSTVSISSVKLQPTGANLSPDGNSTIVHSNGQSVGYEQVFHYLNPTGTLAAGTYNLTVTISRTTDDLMMKVLALAGTDNATAPTYTTFAPSGAGTTTAMTITTGSVATGSLATNHFCAGSAISSVNQTQQCIAQGPNLSDAASAMATQSAAGAGSTINFTGVISAADWYAAIAAVWTAAGGAAIPPIIVMPPRRP